MKLDELHATIVATEQAAWFHLRCHGERALAGKHADRSTPAAPAVVHVVEEYDNGVVSKLRLAGHGHLLVLRDDVDVSIAWGAAAGEPHYRGQWMEFGWRARGTLADVRYRGALVDRVQLVELDADGLLITVPAPGLVTSLDWQDPEAPFVFWVVRRQHDIARLIHLAQGRSPVAFDSLLDRADFRVVDRLPQTGSHT